MTTPTGETGGCMGGDAMHAWVLFGAGAVAAMLVVLHGFGNVKESADIMLDVYEDMLKQKSAASDEAETGDAKNGGADNKSNDIPTASPG